ncbi:MAG: ferritin family protein [Desulfuromonadales bacterium]|nr:ferritin family protein [Desulfuromonadales bacterium]
MIEFVRRCVGIEEMAAQVYREFARQSQQNPELVSIWQEMARDEEMHADQLRFALRMPAKEAFEGVIADVPDPGALCATVEGLLARAKAMELTTLDMLKDAVTLEKEFRKVHATYVLLFKEKKMFEVFQRLAREDDQHIAALQGYIQVFKEQLRTD